MFRKIMKGMVVAMCAAVLVCAGGASAAMRKEVISSNKSFPADGQFNVIAEPFDWGKDITRLMLKPGVEVSASDLSVGDFKVHAKHYSEQALKDDYNGARKVTDVYPVDTEGNKLDRGEYILIEMEYGSGVGAAHTGSYNYANYYTPLTPTYTVEWLGESFEQNEVVNLLCDEFVLDRYTDSSIENENYNFCDYALYSPEQTAGKKPLIIFFHGMGEGGSRDLKNQGVQMYAYPEANFADGSIQNIMGGGAYVLLPQSPDRWPTNGFTEESAYIDVVNGLIDSVIEKNQDIDTNRIYVGGLSMGGYMASRVILSRPDKYAAAFLCAQAYAITEDDAQKLKDLPVWVSCSEADSTCAMDPYTYASYVKLVNAGNVDAKCAVMESNKTDPKSRFRFYDNSASAEDFKLYFAQQEHENVVTGEFVWDNVSYSGHNGGWVGVFANGEYYEDEAGSKVTIMDWLASKHRYTGLEIDAAGAKKTYTAGEPFTGSGLVVNAVDRSGVKTAVTGYTLSDADTSKAGTVKVTVSYLGMSASYDITVSEAVSTQTPAPVQTAQPPQNTAVVNPSIQLSSSSVTLFKKDKAVVKATVSGSNESVSWSSSNNSVATVKDGVITAKKAGKTVIRASVGGAEAACTVTVKNPTFKVKKTSLTVKKGKKVKIQVTVSPKKAVKFKSSSKVAKVNSSGVVKGVKKGKATITVTYMGMKRTVKVRVK